MEEESEEKTGEEVPSNIGKIEWLDLTVDEASRAKDFYCSVVFFICTELLGLWNLFTEVLADNLN